jgi:hypothetical protein
VASLASNLLSFAGMVGVAALPKLACAITAGAPLAHELAAAAPRANPAAIEVAARALSCALRAHAVEAPRTLSLIDYSLPSSHPRLWVFDVERRRLLFEELVAHGRNSGGDGPATHFSNGDGSRMSSLGVFRTADTYIGHNGYSLRLEGLDAGFNDHALERSIVMHGATYVSRQLAETQGRIGRSWGCPAVRRSIAQQLIDTIRDGSLVVAYYPDKDWLDRSAFVGDCAADESADRSTANATRAPSPAATVTSSARSP